MTITRINIFFGLFLSCLLLSSCCKTDDDVDYQPIQVVNRLNVIYLSLQDTNGQPYNYEQLLNNKSFSVYGLLSNQTIPASISDVEEMGEKRLKFDAELPDKRSMTFNSTHSKGEGFAITRLTIDGIIVNLRVHFSYGEPEDKNLLADNGISIERVYCNGIDVKPKETKFRYPLLTLRKNDKGGFDMVE